MSTVSATITPNGSASPVFKNGHDSTSFNKEPSMPADGISRFLSGTGSNSGSATPGSVSYLQEHRKHSVHTERHHPTSLSDSDSTAKSDPERRVKSATNLSHPQLNTPSSTSTSTSPPKSPSPPTSTKKPKKFALVSPYESARGADPNAGKSVTQLKIDLQRMSTLRDTPSSQHPLLLHGSMIPNLSPGGDEVKARYARDYAKAQTEFRNGMRFHPDLLTSTLSKKSIKEKLEKHKTAEREKMDGAKGKGKPKTPVGSSGDKAVSRGRLRFEVGRSLGEDESSEVEEHHGDGVQGLLERMWAQTENLHGGDE